MSSTGSHDGRDEGAEGSDLVDEILRELNEPPVTPAPANGQDDKLPFDPARVSMRTLLRYGNEYRNREPLLAQVMIELHRRDCTPHQADVRALQRRWEYLVRIAQPVKWPDSAIEREDRAFHGRCFQCGAQGMLAFFGYHVGRTRGLPMPVRHQILDYIYKGRLPTVTDESYTRSWGQPSSPERLKRLSSVIAYLARNAQANENADYEDAISDWDADLRYLKSAYFRPAENPYHDWDWPMLHID